jgi:hypothetical protein
MSLERIASLKQWVRRRDEEIRNLLRKVDRLDAVIAEKDEVIRRLEVRIEDRDDRLSAYVLSLVGDMGGWLAPDGVVGLSVDLVREIRAKLSELATPRGYIDIEVERTQAEWDGRHPAPPAPQQKKQLTEKQLANLAAGRAKLHGRAAS